MSVVMEAGRRVTAFRRQPPELIVRTLLTGDPQRPVGGEDVLALLAHFGYGASFGALFGLLTRRCGRPGMQLGVGYALLLWLISYAGWVPAAGILAPPRRDDAGRQLALVVGHVVYGAVLAVVLRRPLRGRSQVRGAA
jgi:uncharacterized membrane protein YagU involved in acid resistance